MNGLYKAAKPLALNQLASMTSPTIKLTRRELWRERGIWAALGIALCASMVSFVPNDDLEDAQAALARNGEALARLKSEYVQLQAIHAELAACLPDGLSDAVIMRSMVTEGEISLQCDHTIYSASYATRHAKRGS